MELITGGQATLRHMPGSKRDKDVAGIKPAAAVPPPRAAQPTKTAAALKGKKPAAAVSKVSKDKEEIIEDEFFHGALD